MKQINLKKLFLPFLLAAALVFAAFGFVFTFHGNVFGVAEGAEGTGEPVSYAATVQSGESVQEFSSCSEAWNAAVSMETSAESYATVKLFANWTATDGSFGTGAGFGDGTETGSGFLRVPSGKYLILDLNGFNVDRGLSALSEAPSDGSVLRVGGNLILKDTSQEGAGGITGGNTSGGGGGVYAELFSSFEMESGNIFGNRAAGSGGGVYADGVFALKGGKITNNDATLGGGVYSNEQLSMAGGEISGNRTADPVEKNSDGGGVYMDNNCRFTMSGGTISGNVSAEINSDGGGIFMYGGEFNLTGGEIRGNTIGSSGGGVYMNDGVFNLTGGAISGNHCTNSGGGVCVFSGTFTMSGGKIAGNDSDNGGGLYTSGKLVLTGGEISGNVAKVFGGGVNTYGTFELSGNARVTGNVCETADARIKSDVYMPYGKTFTITDVFTGELSVDLDIDPTFSDHTLLIATGASNNEGTIVANDSAYAVKTEPYTDNLVMTIYVAEIITSSGILPDYYTLQDAWNAAIGFAVDDPVTMKIYTDWTAISGSFGTGDGFGSDEKNPGYILVPYGYSVAIDLNGHTVNRDFDHSAEHENGFVIKASGDLAITDTSLSHAGKITGGCYAGVFVDQYGSLKMSGGTITGNHTENDGGGVYVSQTASFTMSGGKISGNDADYGGGVYVGGEMTMDGGEIIENTAVDGGGVYVGGGTFTMSGGKISNNIASGAVNGGGGVYLTCVTDASETEHIGEFYLMGGEISNNTTHANGGGLYAAAKTGFQMISGTITGNKAESNGGGAYMNVGEGRFAVESGTVSKNSAFNGGGVFAGSGELEVTGGEFVENKASNRGGGISVNGTLSLAGLTFVRDNTREDEGEVFSDNIYLGKVSPITVSEFTGWASISLITKPVHGNPDVITNGWEGSTGTIISNDPACTVKLLNGELAFSADIALLRLEDGTETEYSSFREAWNAALNAGSGATLVLQANWTATSGSFGTGEGFGDGGYILLPAGKSVLIDLNGYEINRALASPVQDGYVMKVAGTLTVKDGVGVGRITGGNNSENGGGVYVDGGTLSVESGLISENTAANGGGVYVHSGAVVLRGGRIYLNSAENGGGAYLEGGTITVESGIISENTATSGGGAYINGGTFAVEAGVISENSADNGSGVYSNATLTMSGGEISSNLTRSGFGGVYVNGGEFVMGGSASVSNNTKADEEGTASNVFLTDGMVVRVEAGFEGGLGVTAQSLPQTGGIVILTEGWADASENAELYSDEDHPVRIVNVGEGKEHALICERYSISYFDCGEADDTPYSGMEIGEEYKSYTPDEELVLPEPYKEGGFAFVAWHVDKSVTSDTVTSIREADWGDKKFYAEWVVTYTVTFYFDNGEGYEEFSTQDIPLNGTPEPEGLPEPEATEEAHFVDGRWVTEENGTTAYDFTAPITEATSVYAVFTEEAHIASDWILEQAPSSEEKGIKHRECVVCAWWMEEGEIDTLKVDENGACVTGGSDGKVVKGGLNASDAPAIDFAADIIQLRAELLDDEDEQNIINGKDARIYLQSKAAENVSDEMKAAVAALATESVYYLDLAMYKKVGSNEAVRIDSLPFGVAVTLSLPEGLRANEAGYRFMRFNGETWDEVEFSYNAETSQLSFETDALSVYALVFTPPVPPVPEPAPVGAIVGGTLGGVVLILAALYLAGYFLLYRKHKLDGKAIKVLYCFLPLERRVKQELVVAPVEEPVSADAAVANEKEITEAGEEAQEEQISESAETSEPVAEEETAHETAEAPIAPASETEAAPAEEKTEEETAAEALPVEEKPEAAAVPEATEQKPAAEKKPATKRATTTRKPAEKKPNTKRATTARKPAAKKPAAEKAESGEVKKRAPRKAPVKKEEVAAAPVAEEAAVTTVPEVAEQKPVAEKKPTTKRATTARKPAAEKAESGEVKKRAPGKAPVKKEEVAAAPVAEEAAVTTVPEVAEQKPVAEKKPAMKRATTARKPAEKKPATKRATTARKPAAKKPAAKKTTEPAESGEVKKRVPGKAPVRKEEVAAAPVQEEAAVAAVPEVAAAEIKQAAPEAAEQTAIPATEIPATEVKPEVAAEVTPEVTAAPEVTERNPKKKPAPKPKRKKFEKADESVKKRMGRKAKKRERRKAQRMLEMQAKKEVAPESALPVKSINQDMRRKTKKKAKKRRR